jgi:hypothetical protein
MIADYGRISFSGALTTAEMRSDNRCRPEDDFEL